jgi:hypothetical protein
MQARRPTRSDLCVGVERRRGLDGRELDRTIAASTSCLRRSHKPISRMVGTMRLKMRRRNMFTASSCTT